MFRRPSKIFLALVALTLAVAPAGLEAQDKVHAPSELTEAPRLADNAEAARILSRTTPSGKSGRVQIKLIVNADGSVDAASIEVVAASDPDLVTAATQAVRQLRFEPGKVDGQPVRSVVLFPVRYAG